MVSIESFKHRLGRPSISGSGHRILPAAVIDPFGDIMKPPGEYPPDRAAEFTSTIEDAFDICLEIPAISGTDPNEDLRLSERFCSS
ncbi:hypothetical protein M7I_7161 [Glarea lozoyensis 74030]|uniref:Uncharacterized protein n=1 Tax=Glarea lozoyensis (strain ATCC 74030 / MF5533) TaxID=1104152 RepID=H0EWJ4_GLAL7|nr:hypothetical protein M7I_7161 [Glarea lozoyensis 74030]